MKPNSAAALFCLLVSMASAEAAVAADKIIGSELSFRTGEGDAAVVDDDYNIASNVSGIACLPPNSGTRVCMVIDDQGRKVNMIEVAGQNIVRKSLFSVIGERPSPQTLGTPPVGSKCSAGTAKFKDLDGEAVAFEAPYFYVVGSHGCSRKSMKFRTSSFIVARIKVDAGGNLVDESGAKLAQDAPASQVARTTYRLADALNGAADVGKYFGEDLTSAEGLNIEGAVVMGGRLFAGLRGRVIGGTAYLVSVRLDHLFADRNAPSADVQVIPISLEANAGIRDIARLDDGQVLLLTGPAQEQQNVSYRIWQLDLRKASGAVPRATLESPPGKAEGMAVTESDADQAKVIVVFDGPPQGAPSLYSVPLR